LEVYVMFLEMRNELRENLKSTLIRRHIIRKYFTWMRVSDVNEKIYLSGHYQSSLHTDVYNNDLFPLSNMVNSPPNMKDFNVGDDLRSHGTTYFLHWTKLSDPSNREMQKYNLNANINGKYKGLYVLNNENIKPPGKGGNVSDNDKLFYDYISKLLNENGVHSNIPVNTMLENGHLELDKSSEYKKESSLHTQTLDLLYFLPQSDAIQNKYTGELKHELEIKYRSKDNKKIFDGIFPNTNYTFSISENIEDYKKLEDFNSLASLFHILTLKKLSRAKKVPTFPYVFAIACTKHRDNKRQAKDNALPFFKLIQRKMCDDLLLEKITFTSATGNNYSINVDNTGMFQWVNNNFQFEDDDFKSSEDNCIYIFHLLRLPLGDEVYGSEGLYFWKYLDFIPVFKIKK